MPEKWTGQIVGKMHVHKISMDELAKELGYTRSYVWRILNSQREPSNIQERMEKALDQIIEKRGA